MLFTSFMNEIKLIWINISFWLRRIKSHLVTLLKINLILLAEHHQEVLSLHWHAPFGVRASSDHLGHTPDAQFCCCRAALHAEFTSSIYASKLCRVGNSTADFKETAYDFATYLSLCSSKLKEDARAARNLPYQLPFMGYTILCNTFIIFTLSALSSTLMQHCGLQRRWKQHFLGENVNCNPQEEQCEKHQRLRYPKHFIVPVTTMHKEMQIFLCLVVTSACFKNK